MASNATECVKVMVRVRPMNELEIAKGRQVCTTADRTYNQIMLHKPEFSETAKTFSYDSVFGPESEQQAIYDESAFSLVESVLKGYNGTIFAYGQTGCGKTHTMLGVKNDPQLRGIMPNAFRHIFGYIDASAGTKKFLVRCSYLEIYNEEIHDLLGRDISKRCDLRHDPEKGAYVKELNTVIVKSVAEIERAMNTGSENRKTGETAMNKESSRSHSIFTIYVETASDDPAL